MMFFAKRGLPILYEWNVLFLGGIFLAPGNSSTIFTFLYTQVFETIAFYYLAHDIAIKKWKRDIIPSTLLSHLVS